MRLGGNGGMGGEEVTRMLTKRKSARARCVSPKVQCAFFWPSGEVTSLKTDVAEPTHNPIWNATLNFTGVAGEQLHDRMIEVTLWDYCPDRDSIFLGGCSIDLASAFEADRSVW